MERQTKKKHGMLVAEWASPSTSDNDVRWGLLQGPAITDQSTSLDSVPLEIWSSATLRISDMAVIHVTSPFKAAEIGAGRETEEFRRYFEKTARDKDLITHSYGSLLKMLRRNTVPFDGSTPYDWTDSELPPVVLFLIDADPDVSAEYFLLLVVLTTWATEVCINRPEVTVRVLMISSLPLQPLVRDLFEIQSSYPFKELKSDSQVDNFDTITVVGSSGVSSAVLDKIKDSNPELSHMVLCFRQQVWKDFPKDWDIGHHFFDVKSSNSVSKRRLGILINGLHVPAQFVHSGFVHIVTGETRERLIFDRSVNQIARVNVKLSGSERQEQIAWASHPDCRDSIVML